MKLINQATLPDKKFTKKQWKEDLNETQKELFELQNKFYADNQHSLLILFQGIDSSGKDGTIRHVMTGMNPMGVQVRSFKKPTEVEISYDFL
jgi:polyphosphate kinase 2 (PPK2 family)